MKKFRNKFQFRQSGSLLVGIERECFLLNQEGKIAPIAHMVLGELTDKKRFGYELSACQLEDRIGPCKLSEVKKELMKNERDIGMAEAKLLFKRLHAEVAPEDMPLDVYPDPTGRYQEIIKSLPENILRAACRVTGTHVHIGMPDHDTALKVYNQVISQLDKLCREGDGSFGQRLVIYKTMAPEQTLRPFEDWNDFYQQAVEKKFADDPRKCWHLIRLSIHGTIEFRMFGATDDLNKIEKWAKICHKLCGVAMGL